MSDCVPLMCFKFLLVFAFMNVSRNRPFREVSNVYEGYLHTTTVVVQFKHPCTNNELQVGQGQEDTMSFADFGISCLRYTDYICSEDVLQLLMQQLENELEIPVVYVPAPPNASGPRIGQAVHAFSENQADIGRI